MGFFARAAGFAGGMVMAAAGIVVVVMVVMTVMIVAAAGAVDMPCPAQREEPAADIGEGGGAEKAAFDPAFGHGIFLFG